MSRHKFRDHGNRSEYFAELAGFANAIRNLPKPAHRDCGDEEDDGAGRERAARDKRARKNAQRLARKEHE